MRALAMSISPEKTGLDRKSTRLNSSHSSISYAVFCLKKKNNNNPAPAHPVPLAPARQGPGMKLLLDLNRSTLPLGALTAVGAMSFRFDADAFIGLIVP